MSDVQRNRPKTRRAFLATAGLGLVGLTALGACATQAPSPTATTAPAAKPTEAPKPTAAPTTAAAAATATPAAAAKPATGSGKLTVWGYQSFTPAGDKALGDSMQAWAKANNTELEYVVIENATYPQKLAAAVEAKTPPDVSMFTSPDRALYWQSRSQLVDVSDVWGTVSKQAGGFFDSVLEVYKADSKFWAIPFETDCSPFFTRLDLMEKATGKREPPKTMDELGDVAKKITTAPSLYAIGITLGRVPDTIGMLLNLVWCDGGAYTDKDGKKPAWNSDGTITAVKRIQQWWKDKVVPADSPTWDDTGNNNAYQSKQVAFIINPPSVYDWMVKNDQELLGNSTMAPLPAGKAGSFQGAGSWSWTIFNASKNADGAKSLITHLLTPDQLRPVYEAVGGRWYPIYKDMKNDQFWTSKPHFKYYPDMIAVGRAVSYPAAPEAKLMQAIGEIQDTLVTADMIQSVILKNVAPEEAVASAQKKMEDIFKKYGLG